MPLNFGMPRPESILVKPDGTINRDWYLFLAAILQAIGGPAVGPGGGVPPIDNQMQFEEYAVSSPEALSALAAVDELRNAIATILNDGQSARVLFDELNNALSVVRIFQDYRNRIEDLENQFEAQRPIPVFPVPEQFIAPTLINSWVNFGGGFNSAGYYKDPFGIVHLRGMISTGTLTSAAFILPLGYRPVATELFAANSNDAMGRLTVDASGNVVPRIGSNVFFSLDGLTFRAI